MEFVLFAGDVLATCLVLVLGVQITANGGQSRLRHVVIEEAGLLDYFTNHFIPALQIDRNNHLLSHLTITKSSSSGILTNQPPAVTPVSQSTS